MELYIIIGLGAAVIGLLVYIFMRKKKSDPIITNSIGVPLNSNPPSLPPEKTKPKVFIQPE